MWKKAVPAVALCSFLLVGCNANKTVPSNNETPMQDIREDVDRMAPKLNGGNRVNTPSPTNKNDNNYYNNNNGYNGGVRGNNGINNPPVVDETVPNDTIINPTPVPGQTIQEDVKIKAK